MVTNKSRVSTILIQTVIVLAIVVFVNLLSRQFYGYLDFTEEKRFTLSTSTKTLLEEVDDVVYIDVLLDGELPAGYKRLKARTIELLNEFNNINRNIDYNTINPIGETTRETNTIRENLAKDGVLPANIFIQKDDQLTEQLIYPYIIIKYGNRKIPVNLLEPRLNGEDDEAALNRSGTMLEYKLGTALSKLFSKDVPIVIFSSGNGELPPESTAMLESELRSTMSTGRIDLDTVYQLSPKIDILVVARPTIEVDLKNKFVIDQYIMNGGKVIWIVEQFHINLDSVNQNQVYIPKPMEHNLDDLFFKYGVRINKDLILDLENTKIPQVVGVKAGESQTKLFDWVYNPLLQSNSDNPIVKNIDRVRSTFPSTISILDNKKQTEKSILLTSSEYSRFQKYPMRVSFNSMRIEQRKETYNKSFLPAAVLLEGEFESFFKNRVTEKMNNGLNKIGAEFVEKSKPTSQVFISDSDVIKNLYDVKNGTISPMGWDKWNKVAYRGNRDFIINAIEYLLDDYGLIESRSKNVKLRLLDQVELTKHKFKWQAINLILPSLSIILFGLIFNFMRKRKYTS